MGGFRRLGPVVAERFRDERLRRLFSFQAMYAGLPPSRALAIYAVITYMDSVAGVYFPEGGMGAIPVAMARAAQLGGVEFRWGTTVHEILRGPNGRVAAVDLGGGERLRADAVVCTLDTPVAYERLLPGLRGPRAVRSGRYSPSAVVWHVGARGAPPADAAHHNIHFAQEWDSAFDALIGDLELMPDPSRLVTVPSLTDPSLAAPGGSTLYVLEPVPHLGGAVDWNRERGPMRERLMGFLARKAIRPTSSRRSWSRPWSGRPWGWRRGRPSRWRTPSSRPGRSGRRTSTPDAGPGLRGFGDRAGVGVPMVLISGRLAAERVREYLPRTGSGADSGAVVTTTVAAPDLLTEGYRRAARITRDNGTTYYWGTMLLPPERRRHVYAVYALCPDGRRHRRRAVGHSGRQRAADHGGPRRLSGPGRRGARRRPDRRPGAGGDR
jgi:phytoene desaturase